MGFERVRLRGVVTPRRNRAIHLQVGYREVSEREREPESGTDKKEHPNEWGYVMEWVSRK